MGRQQRIQRQMLEFQKKTAPKQIELLTLDPQLKYAIFAFTGPINSPYEGYWFKLIVQWPQDYPFKPPKVKLDQKIWNPYVDFDKDQFCVDILKEEHCCPQLTTCKVILSIISLLGEQKISQNCEGFANPKAAAQMINNYHFFYQQARKICESHSFEKKQLYQDCQRGMIEDHQIKAEGKELEKLVEKESKYLKKKNLIILDQEFYNYKDKISFTYCMEQMEKKERQQPTSIQNWVKRYRQSKSNKQ